MSILDKFNVPMLPASEVSPGLVVREYVSANRPLLLQGYAQDWTATKKWFADDDPELFYLKHKVGNSQISVTTLRKVTRGDQEDTYGLSPYLCPFKEALENILNSVKEEAKIISTSEEGEVTYRKDVIFIEDQDIGARVRELREDYQKPAILDSILRHQATKLTSWPSFERKVLQDDGERVFCSLQGNMSIALVSPVFQQNLYNGVFDDLDPEDVPNEIDLFRMDDLFEMYPLLEEARDYILRT